MREKWPKMMSQSLYIVEQPLLECVLVLEVPGALVHCRGPARAVDPDGDHDEDGEADADDVQCRQRVRWRSARR